MNAKYQNVGNITIPVTRDPKGGPLLALLLLKKPKKAEVRPGKRKKIGQGFWVPPGGGTEKADASQKHAARRELLEETHLRSALVRFRKTGTLRGTVVSTGRRLWLVHLYIVFIDFAKKDDVVIEKNVFDDWKWFNVDNLPSRMMVQDKKWLPRILYGHKLSIRVRFTDEDIDETLEFEMRPLGLRKDNF